MDTPNADPGVWATAMALLAQYGDDAEVIAVLRAAEYAALSDLEGLAQWDRIIACIAGLSETGAPAGQIN